MTSRPQITERPAYGHSRAGSHMKTLRGPDGKERPRDRAAQRCQSYAAWWPRHGACAGVLSRPR